MLHASRYRPPAVGYCRRAFSMIELVIILAIIAIVAALVIPRVSFGSDKAWAVEVASNLKIVNEAMSNYKREHNWKYPGAITDGYPNFSEAFKQQLTESTNKDGSLNGPYGPYIKKPFPVNPYINDPNNKNTIGKVGLSDPIQPTYIPIPPSPKPPICWYVDPIKGLFNINLPSPFDIPQPPDPTSGAKISLGQLRNLAGKDPVFFDKPMD